MNLGICAYIFPCVWCGRADAFQSVSYLPWPTRVLVLRYLCCARRRFYFFLKTIIRAWMSAWEPTALDAYRMVSLGRTVPTDEAAGVYAAETQMDAARSSAVTAPETYR